MSEENMSIWDQVCETDPKFTKNAKVDGMQITSISGQSVILKATEVFGPIGTGWGYQIIEDILEPGAPVFVNDVIVCHEIMHTLKIELWYLHNKTRNTVIQYGHTPYVRNSKFGPRTDFDAKKKSLTDAIKKAFSMVGFNADIFLGMFDDQEYMETAQLKSSIKQSDDKTEATFEAREEFAVWAEKQLKTYALIPNHSALKLTHTKHMKKLAINSAIGERGTSTRSST